MPAPASARFFSIRSSRNIASTGAPPVNCPHFGCRRSQKMQTEPRKRWLIWFAAFRKPSAPYYGGANVVAAAPQCGARDADAAIMSQVILALAAFLLLHSVPAIPTIRGRLTGALGLRFYLLSYSVTSVALLIWVLHAAWNADYVEIWQPDPRGALANLILSPLGLFLVTAGLISPNPASVSFMTGATPGAVTTITRHPVLWGFLICLSATSRQTVIQDRSLSSVASVCFLPSVSLSRKSARGAGWETRGPQSRDQHPCFP